MVFNNFSGNTSQVDHSTNWGNLQGSKDIMKYNDFCKTNRKSSAGCSNSYPVDQNKNHSLHTPHQPYHDTQTRSFTNFSIDYILHNVSNRCNDRKENVKGMTTKSHSDATLKTIGYSQTKLNCQDKISYQCSRRIRQGNNVINISTPNVSHYSQSDLLVQNEIQSFQPLNSLILSSHQNQSVPAVRKEAEWDGEGKINHLHNECSTQSEVNRDKTRIVYPTTSSKQLPNGNRQRYPCKICRKSFANPHCLSRHMRIHTGEKPYRCNICKKAFNQSFHLTIHKRLHTGDLRYQCNICFRRFVQSNDLKKHYRTHTGEKPYQCKSCQKCFADASQLKKHVRIHTGEKPYICTICHRGFTQSGALKKHSHIHK